jgi:hypothetical protein
MFSNIGLEQRYNLTERDRITAVYITLFVIVIVCVILFVL